MQNFFQITTAFLNSDCYTVKDLFKSVELDTSMI